MLTRFQAANIVSLGFSLYCHARHGAFLGSAQCHHDCALFVRELMLLPNFLGAMKFDGHSMGPLADRVAWDCSHDFCYIISKYIPY